VDYSRPFGPFPSGEYCYTRRMDKLGQFFEQFKVHASELGDKVRELIKEGNVRRIIIKDEQGHTFMEIPLTVATVGVVLAPLLAALGAIATMVAHFHVVVERTTPPTSPPPPASDTTTGAAGPTDASVGATEDQVNMADTMSQHMDKKGADAQDVAGTGEHDSLGG
jgi:hypothetical protein